MTPEKLKRMEHQLQELGGSYILNHARRVLILSKLIAEKENVDYHDDILVFASYFHDISAFAPYRPQGSFDHALESARYMPELAGDYGYSADEIEIIVEAVQYHDKAGMGRHNETRLIRNADGVDYLGFMAVARDFSKQSSDMRKAMEALKKRKDQFYTIIDYDSAREMAQPRLAELDHFIEAFEEESFGMY